MADTAKQMSEVDVAYQVLVQNGTAMYFRDLIIKVLEAKGRPIHSLGHAMAEVHTQINMDSRFYHVGKGTWGLTEWMPQRGGTRAVEEPAATVSDSSLRREKLLAEIQQDYPLAAQDAEESE